jgi:hypothetical protein
MLQDQLVCSQTFKSIQHSVDKWQIRVQRVDLQTKKIMKQREKWTGCMKSLFLLAGTLVFDEKSAKL